MDIDKLRALVTRKAGNVAASSDADLEPLGTAPGWATVEPYFRFCLPAEIYVASGVRVLDLDHVLAEATPGAAPGGSVFPFGYVPFASSVGGNLLCLHSDGVFWVDHVGWYDETISYRDSATRKWVEVTGYSAENVRRAVLWLSRDADEFLLRLLGDELESELDELD